MFGDSPYSHMTSSRLFRFVPKPSVGGGKDDRFFCLFSFLIVLVVLASGLFVIGLSEGSDAEPDHSGSCGDGVTYTYSSSAKTLVISKTGSVPVR